jgi:hypothetical protein
MAIRILCFKVASAMKKLDFTVSENYIFVIIFYKQKGYSVGICRL